MNRLLIKPTNYFENKKFSSFNNSNYDTIIFDEKDDFINILNEVGMEKSYREVKQNKLYDSVIFATRQFEFDTIKSFSRYTIYSYDCEIEKKHNIPTEWVTNTLSQKKPSIFNWQSDSLTFDIISNFTKTYWLDCFFPTPNNKDTKSKFLCYLMTHNIHIDKIV